MTKEKNLLILAKSKAIQALKTQGRMDLVVFLDINKEVIDVRTAGVLEIYEQQIFLSQTQPDLGASMIGKEIEATFLIPDEHTSTPRRWGYFTKVLGVLPDYYLEEKMESTPALIIGAPNENLRETTLRFYHRIRLPFDSNVSVQIQSYTGKVSLLDFSPGGVLVSHSGPPQLSVGQNLDFSLFFDEENSVRGQAEVKRIRYNLNTHESQIAFKFTNLSLRAARNLQRMVYRFLRRDQEKNPRWSLNKTDLVAFNDSSSTAA